MMGLNDAGTILRSRLGFLLAIGAGLLVLALDQGSKRWVVEGMNLRALGAIDVLPPFLNFRMAWNTGVNFGLGGGNPEFTRIPLVVFSVLASGVAIWFAGRVQTRVQAIGCGIAAGGAIGNAIDRVTWGAVADFLNMSCCGINNPWSFNVADIAIFAGFAMAVLLAPKQKREGGAEPAN